MNIVEDEKQAQAERVGTIMAFVLILLGGLFIWMNWKKKKS